MTKEYNQDKYLDGPKKDSEEEDVKEKLLYGDEESLEEKEKRKKEYERKQLNENNE